MYAKGRFRAIRGAGQGRRRIWLAATVAAVVALLVTVSPAAAVAPTVSVEPTATPGLVSAEVSGTVDPGDQDTWYSFERSLDGSSWSGFEFEGLLSANSGPQPVTAKLSGLRAGTEYHFRLVANNLSDPEAFSAEPNPTFTTLPVAAPIVSLDPVAGVGAETASFDGAVNPNAPKPTAELSDEERTAYAASWRFECTPACPGTPAPQTAPADDQPHPVAFDATGLEPNTEYTVKLIATNAGAEETVQEQTFETSALAPTVATGTIGSLTSTSARLTAYVDANNTSTTASFEYATDSAFSNPTMVPGDPDGEASGNGAEVAFADVSGLAPATTYFWRVKVQSAAGADEATAPRSFRTWPTPGPDQGGVGVEGRRQNEFVSTITGSAGVNGADIARQGERVVYNITGGSDASSLGANATAYIANRTPNGWVATNAEPPRSAIAPARELWLVGASPRLDALSFAATPPVVERGTGRLYRYVPDTGELSAGGVIPPQGIPIAKAEVQTSDDQRRAVGKLNYPEDQYVLDFADPTLANLALLPDGSESQCVALQWPGPQISSQSQNLLSTDGQRMFFVTAGVDCSAPHQLYARTGGATGHTELISGPPIAGPEASATFVQGTPEGTRAFFTTAARLDPADGNGTTDVYRWTAGVGSDCITCVVPVADVNGGAVLVAEHGDRVFFSSESVLDDGAASGEVNLYVWRAAEPGSIHFVAGIGDTLKPYGRIKTALTTPDGSVLAFKARRNALDDLTGDSGKGFIQTYLYDDRSGAIDCISCAPGGASGDSEAYINSDSVLYTPHWDTSLTTDGEHFFFIANDPLVPEDQNGEQDVYEWHRGSVGLVSNGAGVFLFGASADGREVIYRSFDQLTPDAPADAGTLIYSARVGGGFPERPPGPPTCSGEGCRAPQVAPLAQVLPATSTLRGPGSRGPKRCSKGKVRKQNRCVKRRHHHATKTRRDASTKKGVGR